MVMSLKKKCGGVSLSKTKRNFLLPRSLPTEAFTKFHERPNFLLKSEGSLLSRRLRRAVAKEQIHTTFAKETINIYFLFIGRPFCDLISAERDRAQIKRKYFYGISNMK